MTKPAPGPDQPPIPVRLVTFNTHHGVGDDGRHDLPRLAKVLAAADADVICLQEVDRHFGDRSEDVDQALLLSRALDMQLAWGPAIDEPRPGGRPRGEYGNALLSRLPILISDVHRLPGGGEPRSALRTMLELDGGTLWVTATHLSHRSAGDRAAQVAALAALHTEPMEAGVAGRRLQRPPRRPGARAAARALRRRVGAGRRARRPGRAGGSGSTTRGTPTRRTSPHRRIDQVWVSAGRRGRRGAGPGRRAARRDHLPLVVDLEVRSGV